MKASSCLVVICGILVSSDFALGASFGFQKFIAIKKPADSETAASDDAIIPITDDLVKRAEERFVKMQESMIRDINNQENEESLVQNLQNKTTKQLKKPEIPSKKMKKPLDPSSSPIHADTKSNVKSAAPIDTEGSHSQGEALVTNYWQPIAKDLSKDTLINDRISQQQASAGIVRIDPDAEFIDPKQHKGHIAQDTRTNFKYKSPGVDVDAEEVQSENYNSLDAAPAADLSRDILVNEHMANQLASGSIKADHDAEFIDPKQHQGHVAQRTRVNLKQAQPAGILSRFGADRDAEEIDNDERTTDQKSSGADLSRDILVNEHVASQVSSGLITTDPEAEFVSLDGPNKNTRNYYYTTNNQQQPAALDLSRDTSISAESFYEPQPPANVMMIEPYPEYANRRYRRPTQNSYLRSADRYQRTPQRDLSGDTAINDHISQQQSASGLVMIDPDAELINTDANHQNNVYYYYSYVPNNIDQVPRMKRTESIYQFYQRPVPVVRYPYPQQPVYY